MFTDNCRDEVTLIFLKHLHQANTRLLRDRMIAWDIRLAKTLENGAIRKTFEEVRDRNAKNLQAGSYEAIGQICDEFFKSIAAAETAQVG